MGMKVVVNGALDGKPRMTVNEKFAELMPADFVTDLNAWMLRRFGRTDDQIIMYGDTVVMGRMAYAKLKFMQ
ncbi:hypothetical protein [Paraburkholderia edwinii]|nr:hypothetical protein [Paraburkholderia edwinii]